MYYNLQQSNISNRQEGDCNCYLGEKMKNFLIGCFVSIFCLFSVSALAADFYVSTSGINGSGCGNITSPCRDIWYVLDYVAPNSARIKVAAGTYQESLGIRAWNDATSPKDIVISCGWTDDFISKANTPGDTILESTEPTENLLSVEASLWRSVDVIVDGCVIENSRDGINARNNGGYLSLRVKNSIVRRNNADGIYSYVESLGQSTLELSENTMIQANAGNGVYWVDYDGNENSHFTVNKSYIKGNMNSGVFVRVGFESTSGITTKADFTNAVIDGNISGINITGLSTAKFVTNITNSTITNNFFTSAVGGGIVASTSGSSGVKVIIKNSIVWGNYCEGTSYDIDASTTQSAAMSVTANYSDIGEVRIPSYYTPGAGNINVDPKLSSTTKLLRGSPAIDTARCGYYYSINNIPMYSRVAPWDDIENQARPGFGEIFGCDMGADEFFHSPLCFPVKNSSGSVSIICM